VQWDVCTTLVKELLRVYWSLNSKDSERLSKVQVTYIVYHALNMHICNIHICIHICHIHICNMYVYIYVTYIYICNIYIYGVSCIKHTYM